MRRMVLALAVLLSCATLAEPAGRALTVEDVLAFERVSDPQLSPDGTQVLYSVAVPDLQSNRLARNIWLVSLRTGDARALTRTGLDSNAVWSPDGRRIAFVSERGGSAQLYVQTADATGEPTRLTALTGGVDHLAWSPDGRTLAFTSEVHPDCRDMACNAARAEAERTHPSTARIYDGLLYRHWSTWSDGTRRHLFVVPSTGGAVRDLVPGAEYDVPLREREGPHPIAFAADSRTICFVAITDHVEATSTNADLFEIDTAAGGTPKRLTTNPGFDGAPAYSPDGRTIAYRSQARAGYESDKWRLMLYDRATGRHTVLTDRFDRSVEKILWSNDGDSLYFNAEDHGKMPVYEIAVRGGLPQAVTPGSFDSDFDLAANSLVVLRSRINTPSELQQVDLITGATRPITRHNDARLSALDMAPAETFTFPGAGGVEVQGMLVRPPSFESEHKYPVILLLHGGPQTQWDDGWSYRWNAQLFAATGSVVVLINRRGSTGAGQKFTDEVAGDWGGKPMEDILKGLDFVLAKYPFADGQRVAAAGGSYGGYLIDWLASQSKGRFKALVSHAGVYDLTSSYGATDELWFPEHDFGGTPWTNPLAYQRMSPSTYAAEFGKYKTPTLVIAGEQDFRVPYTQSLEFYTALQRQGVPSRLLLFPDEGHFVLKPQNSIVWYREVLGWLRERLQ